MNMTTAASYTIEREKNMDLGGALRRARDLVHSGQTSRAIILLESLIEEGQIGETGTEKIFAALTQVSLFASK